MVQIWQMWIGLHVFVRRVVSHALKHAKTAFWSEFRQAILDWLARRKMNRCSRGQSVVWWSAGQRSSKVSHQIVESAVSKVKPQEF